MSNPSKADDIFHRLSAQSAQSVSKPLVNSAGMCPTVGPVVTPVIEQQLPTMKGPHSSRYNQLQPKVSRVQRSVIVSPENAESFDEQVQLISNALVTKLTEGSSISALSFTKDWLDGIVDESDNMYEDVRSSLMQLTKEQLVNYISVLVSALK